jgi:hypothetical protein
VLAALLLAVPLYTVSDSAAALDWVVRQPLPPPEVPERFPQVWQVESNSGYDLFSNGLRIENSFLAPRDPTEVTGFRRFDRIRRTIQDAPGPSGIVFHTTESLITPFEESEKGRMRELGEQLLQYVRRHRSYHFVIDRFGRVYRIVAEEERANHAGNSVWADSKFLYVNLNNSFLAVSFEAQSRSEGGVHTASSAQVDAARNLTQVLRSRFHIPAYNCVTHAQVSVNPFNRKIGYHTDWATNFPFLEIGLPDNYLIPLPSLALFGFTYDPVFLNEMGGRLWTGLDVAQEQVRQESRAQGLTAAQHREILQRHYRVMLEIVKSESAATEENN